MIRIKNAGPMTTLQDKGRKGLGHHGITTGGPMDRSAATRALNLVGAPPDAPLLEALFDGLTLETSVGLLVAVTGEGARPEVNGRSVETDRLLRLAPGDTLRLAPGQTGRYRYIAVAGTWPQERVAGSLSYHAQLLPSSKLQTGGSLTIQETDWILTDHRAIVSPLDGPLTYYPHPELDPAHHRTYEASVTDAISRMGTRLKGDFPKLTTHDRLSTALYPGALQLPTSGEAICMMADHPTVGGYVLLGTLTPSSLDRLAQMRPGQSFTLSPVPLDRPDPGPRVSYQGTPPQPGTARHYRVGLGSGRYTLTVEER